MGNGPRVCNHPPRVYGPGLRGVRTRRHCLETIAQIPRRKSASNHSESQFLRALDTSPTCRPSCTPNKRREHLDHLECDNKRVAMCSETKRHPAKTAKNCCLGQATLHRAVQTQLIGWDCAAVPSDPSFLTHWSMKRRSVCSWCLVYIYQPTGRARFGWAVTVLGSLSGLFVSRTFGGSSKPLYPSTVKIAALRNKRCQQDQQQKENHHCQHRLAFCGKSDWE